MNLKNSALLVIDMQYDFMEKGSLAVANANQLIPIINYLLSLNWGLIVASQDWHPSNHVSFASNHKNKNSFEKIELKDGTMQVLWPDHCVQNSYGAKIHDEILISKIQNIIKKGENPTVDSYSAFFDNNHQIKTELDALLKKQRITALYITGLAADYCVKFTAIDGVQLGYKTHIVLDATQFIDNAIEPKYIAELEQQGIVFVNSQSLLQKRS
ncbi:bifunctional nicotinamidase/pyrazinamidase [Flavobacterium agrisoli]|uniref:nicotinamidase n=1 Tax=Flavobacterium agrisoli TaxID=2793066 RepID=A0A934UK65_9FLAO|nr:bifunctional nicotinamidase/pyrazinamidase [Flavobacterium agrisoli]MBK0370140.1 bifunctional nicotinamidase/pyrazinamidase [Flavobacterium agrisoli]